MLILASRSPQRRAILTAVGIDFRVVVSAFTERERGADPVSLAQANAAGKARDVVTRTGVSDGAAVLGVDTVVILDGQSLGSPDDEGDARSMLASLAGREHAVVSALCLVAGRAEVARTVRTRVQLRDRSERAVTNYVATGEWRGRAGGYAIQGAGMSLVGDVHGDYSNVVGLPVSALLDAMTELGIMGPR
jgi:septum formation protein